MTDPVIMKREMTVEDCLNELNYIHIKLTEENVTYFNNFMDMITIDHHDKIVIAAESPVPLFAIFPKTLRIMATSGAERTYHMSADNMLFDTLELSEFETNNSNSILLYIKLDNHAKLLKIQMHQNITDIFATIHSTYEDFCQQQVSSFSTHRFCSHINIPNITRFGIPLKIHPILKMVLAMEINPCDITMGWKPLEI